MVMHIFVGSGMGGDPIPPDFTPDNAAFNYSDGCAVSITPSRARFTRPLIDGQGYENANPGARVRFVTNAATLTFRVQYTNLILRTDTYNGTIVTLANGSVVNTVTRAAGGAGPLDRIVNFGSSTSRTIEIVMPYCASVDFVGIFLPGGSSLSAPAARPATRLVCVGDSITHGFAASDVAHSWPWLLAVADTYELVNHGYGGRQVAPADGTTAASLSPGVATYLIGYNNFTAQTPLSAFLTSYTGFISAFRAVAPTTKLYCITPIWSPNTNALTLENYREQIRGALGAIGDSNNVLVEGLTLMTNDSSRLVDGVHPNDTGAAEIAAALASIVVP